MIEHTILANVILMTLWFVWIRHYFITEKNKEDIQDEIDHWI